VTTDEVLLGVGLIFVLAVGCQVLASRLHIPALILLLPAGFLAGTATDDVDQNRLLGATFQPLVSLSVAVILYDAGLGLLLGKTDRTTRRVVGRLIWLGVPVTWALAARWRPSSCRATSVYQLAAGGAERRRGRSRTSAGRSCSHGLTGAAILQRHGRGAVVSASPVDAGLPAGHDLLVVVSADGRMQPVTAHQAPAAQPGDTAVLLGPVPAPATASPAG
jgi:hypothetical protein